MPSARLYRAEGLVLESRLMGEADLILTLFTRYCGKVRAVARGARKPSSKLVGHLEPITRVDLAMAKGKELDYVTQAQVVDGFQSLKSGLEGVSQGLYMAELINGFAVEGVANPALYSLMLETLECLPSSNAGLVLRYFELHLLKSSGFMPELYSCVECRSYLSPNEHRFSPGVGGTLCSSCTPAGVPLRNLSMPALKVLRFLDGTTLGGAIDLKVEPILHEELNRLLAVTISYWLDREIRSRRFLEQLQVARTVAV